MPLLNKLKCMLKCVYSSVSVWGFVYWARHGFEAAARVVVGSDPCLCGAATPQKIFTLFSITSWSRNVKHIYHYLFIRAPLQMRSLAYRLLRAAVFIQLFDSSKRASGEIPTDRASRCSSPRQPLHFQHSLLFSSRMTPPPPPLCLNRVCWSTSTSQHLRYQRNLLALFGHHWEPRCCYQPPSIIKPYAPCPPNTALFIPPCRLMTSRVKWSELSWC